MANVITLIVRGHEFLKHRSTPRESLRVLSQQRLGTHSSRVRDLIQTPKDGIALYGNLHIVHALPRIVSARCKPRIAFSLQSGPRDRARDVGDLLTAEWIDVIEPARTNASICS